MKKINTVFKILKNEKIPSVLFWDEILKTRIALKLIKLSDERILRDENEYKRFLKTAAAMGLAQTHTDRVVFNKIYELCQDFSLIELVEAINKKHFKKYDFLNENFININLPAKKSVIIINSIEHLRFLEEFILKNKSNQINLTASDIYSKIILDLLFHEVKNVKIILDSRLFCDIVICSQNVETSLNNYKDFLLTQFSAKFLMNRDSEKIRKKIIDEHSINEISIYQSKNITYGFKISKSKSNKIKINYSGNTIIKEKKDLIDKYEFNFNFFEFNFPMTRLDDAAFIQRGISVTKLFEGDTFLIGLSDLDNLYINLENTKKINISDKFIKKYRLKKGDILLSARGTKIKASVYSGTEQAVFSSNLILIRNNSNKILPEYLAAVFQNDFGKALLNQIQRGSHVININTNDVKNLKIPVPNLNKQKHIAQLYKGIHQKLIAYNDEKTNMLQELKNLVIKK